MARGALRWTSRQVAAAAGVPMSALNAYESGVGDRGGAMIAIRTAMEGQGVVFIEDDGLGAGVRFRCVGKVGAHDHPRPVGPATDAVDKMEAEIAADRERAKRKT